MDKEELALDDKSSLAQFQELAKRTWRRKNAQRQVTPHKVSSYMKEDMEKEGAMTNQTWQSKGRETAPG